MSVSNVSPSLPPESTTSTGCGFKIVYRSIWQAVKGAFSALNIFANRVNAQQHETQYMENYECSVVSVSRTSSLGSEDNRGSATGNSASDSSTYSSVGGEDNRGSVTGNSSTKSKCVPATLICSEVGPVSSDDDSSSDDDFSSDGASSTDGERISWQLSRFTGETDKEISCFIKTRGMQSTHKFIKEYLQWKVEFEKKNREEALEKGFRLSIPTEWRQQLRN